jgi:hypothetical protein
MGKVASRIFPVLSPVKPGGPSGKDFFTTEATGFHRENQITLTPDYMTQFTAAASTEIAMTASQQPGVS